MQSHPFTMERLSEASARAANHPRVAMSEKQIQDKLFDELYWRLKYLSKQATRADLTANANQSDGARLALVMHLTDHHEYQAAQRAFDQGVLASMMYYRVSYRRICTPLSITMIRQYPP